MKKTLKDFLDKYPGLAKKYEDEENEREKIEKTFNVWRKKGNYEYIKRARDGNHVFYRDLKNMLHSAEAEWVRAIYHQMK